MRRFLLALAAMLYLLNFDMTPTAQQAGTRITLFDGVSLSGTRSEGRSISLPLRLLHALPK